MSMSVGIITKIGKNYGAVLQAYALQETIKRKGLDVSIINYMPKGTRKSYRVCKYKWGPRGTIGNLKALMHYTAINNASKKFEFFKINRLNLKGNYLTYQQLQEDPPDCQLYISGSDQVWNPLISFDPAYYLMFGSKQVKRASYAASIGIKKIPQNIKDVFKQRLSNFDFISVREKTAQLMLSEMGINAELAIDPTLLLDIDKWDQVAVSSTIKKPYVLCYMVSTPKYASELVSRIKKISGLPVCNIITSTFYKSFGDYQIRDAGPEEFVGLFREAEFIITSSFHGTLFSILYEKPFVSMLYENTGSRVSDFLSELNMEDRIIKSCSEFKDSFFEIDYEEAHKKLKQRIIDSNNILNRIISLL